MIFSYRKGHKQKQSIIQREGISNELRITLWNLLDLIIWQNQENYNIPLGENKSSFDKFVDLLWLDLFKEPVDMIPYHPRDVIGKIREYFFNFQWHEVYDFLEYTLNHFNNEGLNILVNDYLEKELSAYRYVGNVFTEITSEQEIEMLEDALSDHDYPGVQGHLQRSLELLSDREKPDYRNSIKESISAVESMAKIITAQDKATLGEALKILKQKHQIHPALLDAFSKLYGYTSDEEGIRHSMLDDPNLGASDAKYFLLSCTSFINYLKSKLE